MIMREENSGGKGRGLVLVMVREIGVVKRAHVTTGNSLL